MMDRQTAALQNFAAGDNCAQSVFKAYADVVGLTTEQAALVAAGLGGGMGRLRETCGTFTAAVMLCGAMVGEDGAASDQRPEVYALVQRLHARFVEELGSICCAELLHRPKSPESPAPDARTPAYYRARPCARIIRIACGIINEQLSTLPERSADAIRHTGENRV